MPLDFFDQLCFEVRAAQDGKNINERGDEQAAIPRGRTGLTMLSLLEQELQPQKVTYPLVQRVLIDDERMHRNSLQGRRARFMAARPGVNSVGVIV